MFSFPQLSLLEYSRADEEKTPIFSVFPFTKILSQICKNRVDSQMHCYNWYSAEGLMLFNLFRLTFRLISVKGFFCCLTFKVLCFFVKKIFLSTFKSNQ